MDFGKHIEKAEEAVRRKNFAFAVELYRELLDLDPDLGEARAGLRRALRKREAEEGGGRVLRAVRGAAPLVKARALERLGKHAACAKALEDYLATNPLDEEGNLLLGRALEAAGHLRSARAVYEFLAEIAPRNAAGLKRAGAMLARAGDAAAALGYYERALAADPRDQEALKARKDLSAESALARADLAGATHSRERVADPAALAALEREKKRHLSAEELATELVRCEERLSASPSDPERQVELARVHERLGDPEAALELLERALTERPDSYELFARAGDLRVRVIRRRMAEADGAGRRAEADRLEGELRAFEAEHWRRRAALRPADLALKVELGQRLLASGELDTALAELQKAAADPRVGPEARFLMARCFREKGFLDLAGKEYERVLATLPEGHPRAKEILYDLGAILEAAGDPVGARAHYARIYEIDVGYRDVAEKMERLR